MTDHISSKIKAISQPSRLRRVGLWLLAWVSVAGITGIVSYKSGFVSSSNHRASLAVQSAGKEIDDEGIAITPANEKEALAEESSKVGFEIHLPTFIAGPATQLVHVVTDAGIGMTATNPLPDATLHYIVPGTVPGRAADVLEVHEVNHAFTTSPARPAQLVPLPAGTPFKLYLEQFTGDGQSVGETYYFITAKNMVAISFTTRTPPKQDEVVRMYESLKF